MPRTHVQTGLKDQRNRAQLRHRLDRRHCAATIDPRATMEEWIKDNIVVKGAPEIEQLDLTAYLRRTDEIDLPAQERLRFLAMSSEPKIGWSLRGWLALDRIYKAAISIDPQDVWVHHSRAISAKYCAEVFSRETEMTPRRRILSTAWSAAFEAARLAPKEADVHYLLGSIAYEDCKSTTLEALDYFERAIDLDAQHQWALLYRAHCLHDLERWEEASTAYGGLDQSFFVGSIAWRCEVFLEQRAYCLLQAGEVEAAGRQFKKFLNRWATASEVGRCHLGDYSRESLSGPVRRKLWDELSVIAEKEGWTWLTSAMDLVPQVATEQYEV